MLVLETSGVLTFGDTVSEDDDPVGKITIVLGCKDLEVCQHHTGQLFDDLFSAFLESDLSGVGVAVGSIGSDGASDSGSVGVTSFHRWLKSQFFVPYDG